MLPFRWGGEQVFKSVIIWYRQNNASQGANTIRHKDAYMEMKKAIKHTLLFCLLLAQGLLPTSCIKENLDGCERYIIFEYFADGDSDVFAQYIECVSLYVFDENDMLVPASTLGGSNPIVLEQEDLKKSQGAKLMLTGGRYRFVAVGNLNTEQQTEVYNITSGNMAEMVMRHPDTRATMIEGNDPLYLGSKVVEIPDDTNFSTKLRLYSAHQKVSVTVKGYIGEEIMGQSAMSSSSDLELRLKEVSSECDFYVDDATVTDQNLASGERVEYNPTLTLDRESGWYEGKFNILRHTATSPLSFEIVERATERVLCTVTLEEFLKEFYEVDITKQEALIPLIVEFTDEVIVTIPSWMLEHRDPIYGKN